MKISSVVHNQTGSRAKIFHSVARSSNSYFWVSPMCQAPLWMLSMEGCPDCSYIPAPLGSVSKTLTPSSPCYLSSLLLSDCGTTCSGQATIILAYCLASDFWPVFLPSLPSFLAATLLRALHCQRATSPHFWRLRRPRPLLKLISSPLCSSRNELGEISPVTLLSSGTHIGYCLFSKW